MAPQKILDTLHRLPYNVPPIERKARSDWGGGVWDTEPDILMWTMHIGEYTLYCAVVRHATMGHLCGYVGVEKDCPAFRADTRWIASRRFDPEVHGGITYSETREGVRWFGFDCAHAGDISPAMQRYFSDRFLDTAYRDVEYVTAEVRSLAKQVAAYKGT